MNRLTRSKIRPALFLFLGMAISASCAEQTEQELTTGQDQLDAVNIPDTIDVADVEPQPLNTLNETNWPRILGPERNGVATNETLMENWPGTGPELLWTHAIGTGNSGAITSDGNVFIFHFSFFIAIVIAIS